MALFRKRGEEPPAPLCVTYEADADRLAADRAQIAPRIAEKTERIDELALLAEREDPDALGEIATLEAEIATLRKLERQKTHAERQLRMMAAQERERDQWNRDRHLRGRMAKRSADRLAPAKGIREAVKKLVGHLHQLEAVNASMFVAWQENWDGKADALVFPDEVRKLVGHEIYIACRDLGMKFPRVEYQIDADRWKSGGLAELFKTAHEHTKAVMSGELPTVEVAPIELTPEPVQEITAPPTALAPSVEPEFTAMSGRAWQDLQDEIARQNTTVMAADNDFDVNSI